VCVKTSHIAMKEGKERKQALVNVLELWTYQSIMSASSDKAESDTPTFSFIHSIFKEIRTLQMAKAWNICIILFLIPSKNPVTREN
jgi:hypothetical protein